MRTFYLLILLPLLGCHLVAQAETKHLGRLFSSAEERSRLDQLRNNDGKEVTAVTQVSKVASDAASESMSVDGVVKRSMGQNTIWINRQAQDEKPDLVVIHELKKAPSVVFKLPSGKHVYLKPGQSFNSKYGTISDAHDHPVNAVAGTSN